MVNWGKRKDGRSYIKKNESAVHASDVHQEKTKTIKDMFAKRMNNHNSNEKNVKVVSSDGVSYHTQLGAENIQRALVWHKGKYRRIGDTLIIDKEFGD